MRVLHRAIQGICLSAVALRASVCLAQPDSPVELTWEAPKTCPQETEVQQQLRALLGDLGGVQPTPFLARGTIEPLAGRYRLTLLIERHSARGTRVIESDDCTSLAKAATIVLGLLVRKEKTLGRELSESEISGQPDQPKQAAAQAAKPPEPAEPPKPVPPPAPVPEAPQPMQWLLRAPQGHLDFSTLPHLGYGVGLGIGIEYRSWRALMSGAYFGVEHVAASVRRGARLLWLAVGPR
jgi:hypothetical protein